MISYNNKSISELSWIHRGGVAYSYYEPENLEEFKNLLSHLYREKSSFQIVGMTSNIYFKDTYNIENLISTRKLTFWEEIKNGIRCDCGVSASLLSRKMVDKGYKGFEGLIDLPGTIGGAIYGNAGCFGCLVSDLVESVDVLNPDGQVCTYTKGEMGFSHRMSNFKNGKICGVILSAKLKVKKGDDVDLKAIADKNHELRKQTQPSPKNNLGTIYCELGKRTKLGRFVGILGGVYFRLLKLKRYDIVKRSYLRELFELNLAGGHKCLPYLEKGRFIWKNKRADTIFEKYQRVINRLYRNPRLEIEIKA